MAVCLGPTPDIICPGAALASPGKYAKRRKNVTLKETAAATPGKGFMAKFAPSAVVQKKLLRMSALSDDQEPTALD